MSTEVKTAWKKILKMKILTNEQQKLYKSGKICYICKKSLKINVLKTTNILKLEIIVII